MISNHNDSISWILDILSAVFMFLEQVEKGYEKLLFIRTLL